MCDRCWQHTLIGPGNNCPVCYHPYHKHAEWCTAVKETKRIQDETLEFLEKLRKEREEK